MDRAYYQRPVSSADILAGNVSTPSADTLRNALASRVASR
jgi:lipid-binding SYLF domain-containing protein